MVLLPFLLTLAGLRCDRAPLEFSDGVRRADWVVSGEIVRITTLPLDREAHAELSRLADGLWPRSGVKVAEIAVERVFKGDPTVARLAFFAEPIDVCDESRATVGERGLFFLERDPWRDGLRAKLADACQSDVGAREVLDLGVGGAARLLDDVHEGRIVSDSGVCLQPPRGAKVTRLAHRTLLERAEVELALVETIEKQGKPLLELALTWSEAGDAPWRLKLNREGRVRIDGLARTEHDAFEHKLRLLHGLERALTVGELPANGASIAIVGPIRSAFELTLHANSGSRRYSIQIDPAAPASGDDTRLERIWTSLRSSFDFEPLPAEVARTFDVRRKRVR